MLFIFFYLRLDWIEVVSEDHLEDPELLQASDLKKRKNKENDEESKDLKKTKRS